jgi:molybdopterin synthase catalytic subunit
MIGLTEEPLDLTGPLAAASGPGCGGIGVFVGVVRESPSVETNSERSVIALEYEAHEAGAEQRLGEITREAVARWGLLGVSALHRIGRCELGEPTVVVACGAPHRAEALDACRWVIDTIKDTVPIWKREIYTDGSDWVGAGS